MQKQKANQYNDEQNNRENKIWGDFVIEKMNLLLDKEKDRDGLLFYETAEEIGKMLVGKITMTQIRKVFSEIQKKAR